MRLLLGGTQAFEVLRVWFDGGEAGETAAQQSFIQHRAARQVDVTEEAAGFVGIGGVALEQQWSTGRSDGEDEGCGGVTEAVVGIRIRRLDHQQADLLELTIDLDLEGVAVDDRGDVGDEAPGGGGCGGGTGEASGVIGDGGFAGDEQRHERDESARG